MINLISPEYKRDIKTARINVTLLHYSMMLLSLAALIALVYGLGFWLVQSDKAAVEEKLRSQSELSKTYQSVEREAESFRQNLRIAKRILDSETSYSTFLTTLAKDLPQGTFLTGFSIGGAAATPTKKMTLEARANSYPKVLELKTRLEQSELFEDVSIASATRPDNLSQLSGLDAKYPFKATMNVKLSAKKVTVAP